MIDVEKTAQAWLEYGRKRQPHVRVDLERYRAIVLCDLEMWSRGESTAPGDRPMTLTDGSVRLLKDVPDEWLTPWKSKVRAQKVLYLAGKYRAKTPHETVRNIRVAEAIAVKLWQRGAAVITPHMNTALFDGAADDSVWLRGYLEILKRCDGLVLLPDWTKSEGAQVENDLAHERGMPTFLWGPEHKLFKLHGFIAGPCPGPCKEQELRPVEENNHFQYWHCSGCDRTWPHDTPQEED